MAETIYEEVSRLQRGQSNDDLYAAEVVALPGQLATEWPADTPFDARRYSDVEFQFAAGTVSVTRSLDGVLPYIPWSVSGRKTDGTKVPSTSAPVEPGAYYADDGNAWLKFSAAVVVRGAA